MEKKNCKDTAPMKEKDSKCTSGKEKCKDTAANKGSK